MILRSAVGVFFGLSVLIHRVVAQTPTARQVLEAEQAREAGLPALVSALHGDGKTQALAARAIGRLENRAHLELLVPLVRSEDPLVRRAAAGAIAQMRAPFAWAEILKTERDATVRAAIFEALGRAKPVSDDAESLLVAGLRDADLRSRNGAARGLESLFRLNSRPPRRAAESTLAALHAAYTANRTPATSEEIRELVLLAMHAAGDRDSATLDSALSDPSAQVRRLAVIDARKWVQDPSPLVRYEALRVAATCDRAAAAASESSDHVALEAVDLLGTLKCDAESLVRLISQGRSWRIRAHALVSLAMVDPERARVGIAAMSTAPVWQVRTYAAKAARILKDTNTLAKLARDENPNVAIAAMNTPEDAVRALSSDHSGLVRAGAERLKGAANLKDSLPQLVAAFTRLTAGGAMTVRDPRIAVLTRIGEIDDRSTDVLLRETLQDRDPAIAALAARILNVTPTSTKLPIPTLPSDAYIRGLAGARARIVLHDVGTIVVDLQTGEAPVSVAAFAQLAEAGKYNGLTFHRIVSNFVIQGGSPGADEYDGRSREFLRDELGFARNARGSIGISTRGRDTGDAQIYFNLVDNFRLDREYTVIATLREGLAVMDRVQEGDVIDKVEIVRTTTRSAAR